MTSSRLHSSLIYLIALIAALLKFKSRVLFDYVLINGVLLVLILLPSGSIVTRKFLITGNFRYAQF